MLLPCPLIDRHLQASVPLLPRVLLCVFLAAVCASLPAERRCPSLRCAQERRQLCGPHSAHCGPCLHLFQEDQYGRCLARRTPKHSAGKLPTYPYLDQEIDFLHSVIAKQEVAQDVHSGTAAPPEKHGLPGPPAQDWPADAARNTSAPTAAPPSPHSPTAQPRAGPMAVPLASRDGILVIMISLCVLVGTLALILAAICWLRLQKEQRLAQKVDYPAFGGGATVAPVAHGTSHGDTSLAKSAQMYLYQHQKQQIVSVGKNKPEQKVPDAEVTSDEEEEGGGFKVYECPGLAPTGEMEVKNPLFDDSTLHFPENYK